MKKITLYSGLLLLLLTVFSCSPSMDNSGQPVIDPLIPFSGAWTLTQVQSAGNGNAGVWSAANPSGQTLVFNGSQLSGTAFPAAGNWQQTDSVTLKFIDPSVQPGYRLFTYNLQSSQRVLLLYIRSTNGVLCTEGCGGYRFER